MRTWVSERVYTFFSDPHSTVLRTTCFSSTDSLQYVAKVSADTNQVGPALGLGLRVVEGASHRAILNSARKGFPLNSFCPIFQSKIVKFLIKDVSSSR